VWNHVGLDKNGKLQCVQQEGRIVKDLVDIFHHPSIAVAVVYLFCEGPNPIYTWDTYPSSPDAFDPQTGTEFDVFVHAMGFACVAVSFSIDSFLMDNT